MIIVYRIRGANSSSGLGGTREEKKTRQRGRKMGRKGENAARERGRNGAGNEEMRRKRGFRDT